MVDKTKEVELKKGDDWSDFRLGWANAFKVLFEPFNVLLEIAIIGLFYYSASDGETGKLLVQVLLALTSGVYGGRVAKKLSALNEVSVLEARGRSAVRGLKLLHRSASNLEARVSSFLANPQEIREQPHVTVRNFEEIVGGCRSLQAEALSSIENWTDIVPQADFAPLIGIVDDLRAKIDKTTAEASDLREQMAKAKDEQSTRTTELATALLEKTAALHTLRADLQRANSDISTAIPQGGGLSGLIGQRQPGTLLWPLTSLSRPLPSPKHPPLPQPPPPRDA